MPFTPGVESPRCAVVDLGSNSVRLVVYEGLGRNPMSIFNEKAVLRLGRGLEATGLLNADGMGQAMTILRDPLKSWPRRRCGTRATALISSG
jgi:exopolyphosphatase/guanosine-5'-triphosphate,3'-diphosphate pyrophosphatase